MLILAYHSVHPRRRDALAVPPERFRRHLQFVARQFRVLPLSVLAAQVVEGGASAQAAAITLDDGYRDNLEYALPILRDLALPATVFLTAGYIGSGAVLASEAVIAQNGGRRGDHAFLTWREAAALVAAGVEIGSHSVNHPRLTTLPRAQARKEIQESKAILEDRLGVPVPVFCYPYGDLDDDIRQLVAEAGYLGATVTPRHPLPPTDPLRLPRIGIYHHTGPLAFRLKVLPRFAALRRRPLLWQAARALGESRRKGAS